MEDRCGGFKLQNSVWFYYKMYSVEASYHKVTLLHEVTNKDQRAQQVF